MGFSARRSDSCAGVDPDRPRLADLGPDRGSDRPAPTLGRSSSADRSSRAAFTAMLEYKARKHGRYFGRTGRFERVVDPVHFDGVVGFGAKARLATVPTPKPIGADELLRPLLEHERVVGGRW